MANINFYIVKQKEDKNGLCPIQMQLTFNHFRIRKQLVVKAKAKHWSDTRQRLKSNLKTEPYNNHVEYNTVLDSYDRKARDIFNYALLNEIPLTKEYVEGELSNKYKLLSRNRQFFEMFGEFTEAYKSTKAARTFKKHFTALSFFKEFEAFSGYELRFDTITLEFFDKLCNYAFIERPNNNKEEAKKKKKVCSDNYFAALIASLKTFLNWATERGYNHNEAYKRFKAPEKEVDVIWLSLEELFILYNFPFEDEGLARTRDVYCFGCFTGLRYSDILSLKADEIMGTYIHKTIVKTKKKEIVSLSDFAIAIIDKYKSTSYNPLPKTSEVYFNKRLKECCRIAGIVKPLTVTKFSGGKATSVTLPKCEFITSHTARKTFTTLSNELGMNPKAIKAQTGHKKDVNLNKYLTITDKFQYQEIDKTWNKLGHDLQSNQL